MLAIVQLRIKSRRLLTFANGGTEGDVLLGSGGDLLGRHIGDWGIVWRLRKMKPSVMSI